MTPEYPRNMIFFLFDSSSLQLVGMTTNILISKEKNTMDYTIYTTRNQKISALRKKYLIRNFLKREIWKRKSSVRLRRLIYIDRIIGNKKGIDLGSLRTGDFFWERNKNRSPNSHLKIEIPQCNFPLKLVWYTFQSYCDFVHVWEMYDFKFFLCPGV